MNNNIIIIISGCQFENFSFYKISTYYIILKYLKPHNINNNIK